MQRSSVSPRRSESRPQRGAGVALTATSWCAQATMSFADWVEQGRRLGVIGRSAGWWIGDWLHYGNSVYGERYVRAARVTGYDTQTLMNMVYVASHIERSRRREKLSWSHHAEVVALEPAEQDRWLDRAEADRLSVRCLREEIRRETRAVETARERTLEAAQSDVLHDDEVLCCPSCGHSFAVDPAKPEKSVPGRARGIRAAAA